MVKVKAYAKLDLGIYIEPKKNKDGYYPVHYIDCQIDLSDELLIESEEKDIEVICDHPEVPLDRNNFVYQAAFLLKKISGNKKLGTRIILKKNIPVKAGFGGGSSDAAATLAGLSKLWKIKLDESQLSSLAKVLGKDFYYSLRGGLAEVQGKGKNYKVISISSFLPKFWLLVVVPFETKPSTSWVYEHLRAGSVGQDFDKFEKLKTAVLKGDKIGILRNLTNDFEETVSSYYPVVLMIKEDLAKAGAKASIMAGSGLSVVGFFESQKEAEVGREKLKGKYKQILVARTIN